MSGAGGAIDTMTAEDTALMESMRDDTPLDAPEAVETPLPEAPEPEDETDTGGGEVSEGTPPDKSRMVPHGQFHAANERRKAAEARAIEAERKAAVSEGVVAERLRILTEAAQAAMPQATAAPAIEIPDINTDPVGHFQAKEQQNARELADMKAILHGFTEKQAQAQAAAEVRAWGIAQEEAFAKENPDYGEAMNFLTQARRTQLAALKIVDPSQQQQVIANDVNAIAHRSRAEGDNFAERLYKVAESFGYKKAAPKTDIPALDAGLDALPDRAARIEEGRANSTTISGSGAAPARALTPERIAAMSERQFAAYVEKIQSDPAKLRDLLGH